MYEERKRERDRETRGEELKRGSENEIVKVASGRRGSRSTSERRNEEGPGKMGAR